MAWLHSPLRFIFPLISHSGEGASAADTEESKIVCAFVGTLTAPRIAVPRLRPRQSHGAINAPLHRPALAARASSSSLSYSWEYLTNESAHPLRTIHFSISSPPDSHLAKER